MRSAERSAIEKQVLLNLVELQEKELDFYISNNASIGTMSVLLIGFAFAPELPMVIGGETVATGGTSASAAGQTACFIRMSRLRALWCELARRVSGARCI